MAGIVFDKNFLEQGFYFRGDKPSETFLQGASDHFFRRTCGRLTCCARRFQDRLYGTGIVGPPRFVQNCRRAAFCRQGLEFPFNGRLGVRTVLLLPFRFDFADANRLPVVAFGGCLEIFRNVRRSVKLLHDDLVRPVGLRIGDGFTDLSGGKLDTFRERSQGMLAVLRRPVGGMRLRLATLFPRHRNIPVPVYGVIRDRLRLGRANDFRQRFGSGEELEIHTDPQRRHAVIELIVRRLKAHRVGLGGVQFLFQHDILAVVQNWGRNRLNLLDRVKIAIDQILEPFFDFGIRNGFADRRNPLIRFLLLDRIGDGDGDCRDDQSAGCGCAPTAGITGTLT